MSLIFATQLTAVATAALGVFAIVTAAFAFLAYRKQAQEVGVLVEQNQRETADRRIAQAARVFTAVPRDRASGVSPSAKNVSELPVFDVQFWYSEPGGASGPDDLGTIMPGELVGTSRSFPPGEALARTILTFRDAAGARWIRMPNGDLREHSCASTRESVLRARGVELPKPGFRPPGPGSKHKLPTSFSRRPDRFFGFEVDDIIVVYPLSRGTLHRGTFKRTFPHTRLGQREVTIDASDSQDVYTEERLTDSPDDAERYIVSYDVWNYRDSPITAKLARRDTVDSKQADTPEGQSWSTLPHLLPVGCPGMAVVAAYGSCGLSVVSGRTAGSGAVAAGRAPGGTTPIALSSPGRWPTSGSGAY